MYGYLFPEYIHKPDMRQKYRSLTGNQTVNDAATGMWQDEIAWMQTEEQEGIRYEN